MPRRVFNWTAEDIVRFLKEYGFVHVHTRGSHFIYQGKHGGQPRQVSVPFHGSRVLKPRTLAGIIRQSGIPKNEWVGR
ncbi:type II toxin-antitoxin system HicA family toxin [Candidatus Parcubacteria bacterium]|nr:type II toxin-antitoxin system HicA family toxin [Candidatus Parcubacteria bacterium]